MRVSTLSGVVIDGGIAGAVWAAARRGNSPGGENRHGAEEADGNVFGRFPDLQYRGLQSLPWMKFHEHDFKVGPLQVVLPQGATSMSASGH